MYKYNDTSIHRGLVHSYKNYHNIKQGLYECRVQSVSLMTTCILFTLVYRDPEDNMEKYIYSKYYIGEASWPYTKSLLIPVIEKYCNIMLPLDISISRLVMECQKLKYISRPMFMRISINQEYKNVRLVF